jgi:ribosomal protein S17
MSKNFIEPVFIGKIISTKLKKLVVISYNTNKQSIITGNEMNKTPKIMKYDS